MPAHGQCANFDRRVLEFGLAGDRIDGRIDGRIDAAGARQLRRPVHGREDLARAHRVGRCAPKRRAAPVARHARQCRHRCKPALRRIVAVQLDRRLGPMAGEPRRLSGARHGVPLVAHAAGVEAQRPVGIGRMGRRARRRGDEARAAVGMEEAAVGEEACRSRAPRAGQTKGCEIVVGRVVDGGIGADVEVARAVILEGRERRMLAEDVGDALPGEGLAMAQAARDLGDDPPVLARLAGRRQERPLARDAALGVGDGAVLLGPGERRQADAAGIDRVAGAHRFGDDGELARLAARRARRRHWAGWRRDWSP